MIHISFQKFTLSNGLEVILHEDHSLPIAAVNVWYHVGSKDEEPGRTGFAHLFEHVMFEGSKHHNRSYFEPLQKVGGNLNGSTTADRTNYWENIPSNYLDLALWLEADRMGFLLEALDQKRFDIQREVVKNERRQSYENRPYGMAPMLIQPAVFPPPHPYNWMTIGLPEDLDKATLEDAKAFFRRFYAPSNASLAIAGDFDSDQMMSLVERHFGDIPPGPTVRRVGRMDPDLNGQVSLTMWDRVQLPRLYLTWTTCPLFDPDQAPLDILSTVLSDGKSSRLYRSLVYERQIARDVGVGNYSQEIAGQFHVQVTANPGHDLEEIEAAVREELEHIQRQPPSDREVTRAKNRIESHHVRQLEQLGGFGGRADQLNYYNTMCRDPGAINTDLQRYRAVGLEDVQRVAQSTLGSNFVRLTVQPERTLKPSTTTTDRTTMPRGSTPRAFMPPVPRRTRLPNGLSVVFVPKPGVPIVAFGLLFRAGAAADPAALPGLAHMTATMLPEGTTRRSSQQLAEEMEFMGARLSSEVTYEYALVTTETLRSHWEEALELMADVARNPTFVPQELERVRKERLTDLKRISDEPVAIATQALRSLLYGPETGYGHPGIGTEDSVERMSRGDLVRHFTDCYRPDGATLIVVGDVSEDEVVSNAQRYLGDWSAQGSMPAVATPSVETDMRQPTTIFLADKPGASQSVIRAGHLTVPRHHPDYYALTFLNYVFGGQFSARLNSNLRQDKGYSYGYMSSIDWSTGPSALIAGGGVQTAVTKEAVAETLKEFAEIHGSRPVTKKEFKNARDGILRALPSHFETRFQMLHQLVQLVVFDLPDEYLRDLPDHIKAVSLEDVRRVSQERLHDDHLKILVVGDGGTIEPALRELGLPMVWVDHEGRPLPSA